MSMLSAAAAVLALIALAADPGGSAPATAPAAPAQLRPWAIRLELDLGVVGYDGVSGPWDNDGSALAWSAGISARRGRWEGGIVGLVTTAPLSGLSLRTLGATAGVSLPLADGARRSAWRFELLADAGIEQVAGVGAELFGPVEPAPSVTLPYAGGRAGLSARIRTSEADLVLGAWWIERRDLGTRHPVVEDGAGAGDRYTVHGATRGALLRLGVEFR